MEGTGTDTISKAEEGSATNGSPSVDVSEAAIAIRKYVENAKTDAKEVAEMKTAFASLLADSQTKLADIETARTQALGAATKIEDHQNVVATKSAHIQDALQHADKVRDDLDKQLIAATQHATDSEGQNTRSQTAANDAAKLLAEIRIAMGVADADATAVKAALASSKESADTAKGLADKSSTIESRLEAYEGKLAALEAHSMDQLKTIEGLLPGATSAGLAHAFDQRRQTFLEPRRKWKSGSSVQLWLSFSLQR